MSRERKKQQAAAAAHLQEKLKILRSITHSHAVIISIDHLCSSILGWLSISSFLPRASVFPILSPLLTMATTNMRAAEQHVHNHGRVGVHQGAEAEGGEAEPGDRLRAGRAHQQAQLLLPDGSTRIASLRILLDLHAMC